MRNVAASLVVLFLLLLSPASAFADCTNPAGPAGDMLYNTDVNQPQFCDGTNWVVMGPVSSFRVGLIGHWKLDETTGAFIDSSGNDNDGTQSGGVEYASSGVIGNAVGFDGSNDYIDVGDVDFDNTDFTLSAWININDFTDDDAILEKKDVFYWRVEVDGRIHIRDRVSSTSQSTAVGLVNLNTWHHVVAVFDDSINEFTFYVDGTLKPKELNGAFGDFPNNANILAIGQRYDGPFDPFSGRIDDIRIYERALSAIEVAQLYAYGTADPCSPANSPAVGTACDDSSYYIGDIGAGKVYATAAASESSQTWDDGTNEDDPADSTTDGAANTANLVADQPPPHDAAAYCDGLSAHGQTDWYLPAKDELNLFWNGGSPVAGILADGTWYWSSTESSSTTTVPQRFSDGTQGGSSKNVARAVRCVRTGPLPLPCPEAGVISYNADTHTPMYCDGDHWVAVAPNPEPTAGLVGHWKLDETSGTLKDSSGRGHDGTAGGGVIYASAGIVGNSMGFNGTNSKVQVADHADFDITAAITLSAWVNSSVNSGIQEVINKKADSAASGYRLRFSTSWDEIEFTWSDGVTTQIVEAASSPLDIGQWYHIAATYDLNSVKIYLDGAKVHEAAHTEPVVANNSDVRIGAYNQETAYWFGGAIDDVRIYNRALNAAEIQNLYKLTPPSVSPGADSLIAYWPLNESGGTVAKDFAGSNDGTASGDVTFNSTGGYIKGAAEFDGTDDRIHMGEVLDMGTNDFSFSFWLKSINDGDIHALIVNQDASNTTPGYYFRRSTATSILEMRLKDADLDAVTPQVNYPDDDAWHHVAITVEKDTVLGITAYIDGSEVSCSGNCGYDLTTIGDLDNTEDFFLGNDRTGSGGPTLNGAIDDVRIYNRALSAAEVDEIYQAGNLGLAAQDCTNPNGAEGVMIYNIDVQAPQYCDGANWVKLGGP